MGNSDIDYFEQISTEEFNSLLTEIEANTARKKDNHSVRASRKDLSEEIKSRDSQYTSFLKSTITFYKRNNWTNYFFKLFFFVIAMGIFIGIVVFGLVSVNYIIVNSPVENEIQELDFLKDAIAMMGSITAIVSAIIVLPKTIAEYLFNKDEQKHVVDLIKNFQTHDEIIHSQTAGENNQD